MPKVAVLVGSKSDVPTLDACVETLEKLGIEHELHVMSAHRAPARVHAFAASAADAGFEVIIAAAGMAAHLPGVVAAQTALPVIGVPIAQGGGSSVSGMDALLSIAQMPPGVPVGCMAVNGAKNAALFAAAILALKHDSVRKKLHAFRDEQSKA
jgi:5-(carboxyamino)imidazole ribonucleotide mutase